MCDMRTCHESELTAKCHLRAEFKPEKESSDADRFFSSIDSKRLFTKEQSAYELVKENRICI